MLALRNASRGEKSLSPPSLSLPRLCYQIYPVTATPRILRLSAHISHLGFLMPPVGFVKGEGPHRTSFNVNLVISKIPDHKSVVAYRISGSNTTPNVTFVLANRTPLMFLSADLRKVHIRLTYARSGRIPSEQCFHRRLWSPKPYRSRFEEKLSPSPDPSVARTLHERLRDTQTSSGAATTISPQRGKPVTVRHHSTRAFCCKRASYLFLNRHRLSHRPGEPKH